MTKPIVAGVMGTRKERGGKNWTREELEARTMAAEKITRTKKVRLKPPGWLGDEARMVWKRIVRQTKDLELLDCLDENMLAVYCDITVQYSLLSRSLVKTVEDTKSQQALARLMGQYADKLGLTPSGRARLAKKVADKVLDEFGNEFD
jgi:P27 family predicted phage terminase small subunit